MGYKPHKGAELQVFQVLGPLYGQRDASYRWYETLVTWLGSQGYEKSENDPCLFTNPETKMRVAAHVDDLITRGSRRHTAEFWELVQAKFDVKGWGIVDYDNPEGYIGYTIEKARKQGHVWYTMTMQKDVDTFVEEVGMQGAQATLALSLCFRSKLRSVFARHGELNQAIS